MTRYAIGTAFFGFATLLVGCGPEKTLPTIVQKPDNGPVQKAQPTKSDPDAKAVVDRAVKALTGGKPELLEKAKLCRYSLKGQRLVGNSLGAATQSGALAWPDRVYGVSDTEVPNGKFVTEAWLRRPDLLIRGNGVDQFPGNPAEAELTFAADVLAQQWMAFLLPVTDPKMVVFDPQTVSLENRELKLVKLALANYPVYQLFFDTRSDALLRVEYTVTQVGVPRATAVAFADHKPGPNGLLLPTRLECLHNKTVVEKWTVEKWELPDAIKDDEFTPKKK